MGLVITIDGPAGAGKSTAARILAKKLGILHLNSGMLFRAVALACMRGGVSSSDQVAVEAVANDIAIKKRLGLVAGDSEESSAAVLLDGALLGDGAYSEDAGEFASVIATYNGVRERIKDIQQEFGRSYDLVVDGRDAGSVIFPDADLKVYLVASSRVRAERRLKELTARYPEKSFSLEEIQLGIEARDLRDSSREIAPVVVPPGAIIVDSSCMSFDEVITRLADLVEAHTGRLFSW